MCILRFTVMLIFVLLFNIASSQDSIKYVNAFNFFSTNSNIKKELNYLSLKRCTYYSDDTLQVRLSDSYPVEDFFHLKDKIADSIQYLPFEFNDLRKLSNRWISCNRTITISELTNDSTSRLILFFSKPFKNTLYGEFVLLEKGENIEGKKSTGIRIHRGRRLLFIVIFNDTNSVEHVIYQKLYKPNKFFYN